jgi:hypothetical protein
MLNGGQTRCVDYVDEFTWRVIHDNAHFFHFFRQLSGNLTSSFG